MWTKNKALHFIIALLFLQDFPEDWSLSALPGNHAQTKEVPQHFQWLSFHCSWMILFVTGFFPGYMPCLFRFPVKSTVLTLPQDHGRIISLLPSGTAALMLGVCLCSGTPVVSRKWEDLPVRNSANLRPAWPSSSAFHSCPNTENPWIIGCPITTHVLTYLSRPVVTVLLCMDFCALWELTSICIDTVGCEEST